MKITKFMTAFLNAAAPVIKNNFKIDRKAFSKDVHEKKREFIEFFRSYDDIGFNFWLLVPGIISLFIGLAHYRYGTECVNWPKAEGKIVSINMTAQRSGGGRMPGGAGMPADHVSYKPSMRYEFEVASKIYTSDHRSFGYNSYPVHRDAQAVIGRYKVGQEVTVFYKPDNPGLSVIETEKIGLFSTMFMIGIGFCTVSIILFITAVINRIRKAFIHEGTVSKSE